MADSLVADSQTVTMTHPIQMMKTMACAHSIDPTGDHVKFSEYILAREKKKDAIFIEFVFRFFYWIYFDSIVLSSDNIYIRHANARTHKVHKKKYNDKHSMHRKINI